MRTQGWQGKRGCVYVCGGRGGVRGGVTDPESILVMDIGAETMRPDQHNTMAVRKTERQNKWEM